MAVQLGHRRQTTSEQRSFLLHVAQSYQYLALAAIDCVRGSVFGDPRSKDDYCLRVRGTVQNLGLELAEMMRGRGQRYHVSHREANGFPDHRTLYIRAAMNSLNMRIPF